MKSDVPLTFKCSFNWIPHEFLQFRVPIATGLPFSTPSRARRPELSASAGAALGLNVGQKWWRFCGGFNGDFMGFNSDLILDGDLMVNYHPVIKRGLLENGACISVMFLAGNLHSHGIFQPA